MSDAPKPRPEKVDIERLRERLASARIRTIFGGGRPVVAKECINAVAQWMAAEVERTGYLEHETAAREIQKNYPGLVYPLRKIRTNRFGSDYIEKGNASLKIRPEALQAFKKLTSKAVVWEKDARAWRKRKS